MKPECALVQVWECGTGKQRRRHHSWPDPALHGLFEGTSPCREILSQLSRKVILSCFASNFMAKSGGGNICTCEKKQGCGTRVPIKGGQRMVVKTGSQDCTCLRRTRRRNDGFRRNDPTARPPESLPKARSGREGGWNEGACPTTLGRSIR